MDLMDIINYACWIGGALIGFWIARVSGSPRIGQILGAILGAFAGGLSFFLSLIVLDWWDKRGKETKAP